MIRFIWAYLLYTWGGLHRYFGNQNSMRGEHETAVSYFTRALQTDPTFRQARLARGVLLGRELARFEEALADFDALLAADPHDAPALLNRALVLQQNGRFRPALTNLETYLSLPHTDPNREEAQRIAQLLRELIAEENA
ncbi:MAG: tetratricopeptide repeat protein [Chloroflexota bacterium]